MRSYEWHRINFFTDDIEEKNIEKIYLKIKETYMCSYNILKRSRWYLRLRLIHHLQNRDDARLWTRRARPTRQRWGTMPNCLQLLVSNPDAIQPASSSNHTARWFTDAINTSNVLMLAYKRHFFANNVDRKSLSPLCLGTPCWTV